LCEHKADGDVWFDVHRTAHELGLRSNATMLYGHIEQARHRIDHLLQLRALQDETGGFQTLIPLAFHPANTELEHIQKPNGSFDLRMMAVARLMLDNFDHIKAYWIMLGEQTAQLALRYGADDIDGTVVHELIYHDAGAETPEGKTVEELHQLIREAGREPVERDTLYRRVIRNGASWTVGNSCVAVSAEGS
jgi:aminodeoxyfutalosine synthase